MNKIILLGVFLFCLFFITSCDQDYGIKSKDTEIYNQLKNVKYGSAYSVIAHGAGGVQSSSEHYQTNSRESMLKSIEDGKKLIEFDFQVTSDGVIVGSHHWEYSKKHSDYQGAIDNRPLSLEDFKKLKLNKTLTPIDIFEINEIFRIHPDLILVTDKIVDFELITKQFAWLDRLIVECFSYDECLDAMDYGINNVALNIKIDVSSKLLKRKIALLKSMDIKMVTFNAKVINDKIEAMNNAKTLIKEGFINLVYTSNDDKFIKNNIGISASSIYTDTWSLKLQKCTGVRCATY